MFHRMKILLTVYKLKVQWKQKFNFKWKKCALRQKTERNVRLYNTEKTIITKKNSDYKISETKETMSLFDFQKLISSFHFFGAKQRLTGGVSRLL